MKANHVAEDHFKISLVDFKGKIILKNISKRLIVKVFLVIFSEM